MTVLFDQIRNYSMEIRDAAPADAPACCVVLRSSITELCHADHNDDPEILARWLRKHTIDNLVAMIQHPYPHSSLLVAVENGEILAVGSVTGGAIGLNYVSPDARFRGVSRALLGALEARAFTLGNEYMRAIEARGSGRLSFRCTLTSTKTARRFCLSNGYVEDGPPCSALGMDSLYPLAKILIGPTHYVFNEWRPGMGEVSIRDLDLEGGSALIFADYRQWMAP
jgi:GNAT superfamily N-acetyltransferase